ncbi:hypothetical protein GQ44DRAFT_740745 [Phaeosphaeriaceae sp. PMI808]|nr:hypothetical protein GQ44DRAFT_740745 [Phaeosphaeriaceae sp. PMI808]
MSKSVLVIFGVTGNQGNSELSNRYIVRAVSRDNTNPQMQDLKSKGAELVQGDLGNVKLLPATLRGADTQYQGNTREIETRQAKDLCKVALEEGLQYIIFSSMPHPYKISDGKLKNVELFDCKAEIEQYIRSLPVKSAFFAPGTFMQNFLTQSRPQLSSESDGTYVLKNLVNLTTELPFVDITDTGKWIGAILADPTHYEGKFFAAAERFYTLPQACEIISKVTGKQVTFQPLSDVLFKSFLPAAMREALYEMWVHMRDYGYYGVSKKKLVSWAKQQANGDLTKLEGWLGKENYRLEY